MKKNLLIMLVILLVTFWLFSAEKSKSSLALILSADTFKMGFRDESGNALSEPSFSLNKTNLTYKDVNPTATTDDDSNIYYSATVTFYVWWEALVSTGKNGVKIKLTASPYLKGTTSSDRLYAVTEDKMEYSSGTPLVQVADKNGKISIDSDITADVAVIKSDKIYTGSKCYILGYDLRNAESGMTYTGTVSLTVEVNS